MRFGERFFPDFLVAFLVAFLLEALLLVEAFVVEARLLPFAPARFLVAAALVFLLADFLVLFLAAREVVDFFAADRPLLDFLAADLLRAFVVGILSSLNASCLNTVRLLDRERPRWLLMWVRDSPAANALVDEPAAFATKQRPFIAEEALPVVDYALVFPPGLLRRPAKAIFPCFLQTLG